MRKVLLIVVLIAAVVGAVSFSLFFRGGLGTPTKYAFARLEARPGDVRVEVEEGKRVETSFSLKNTGGRKALLNFYKSEEAVRDKEVYAKLVAKLLSQKNLNESATAEDLKKVADFSGSPWLLIFPYYAVVEPGESLKVKLTIEAKDLAAGTHRTNLVVFGVQKEEVEIIPVEAIVLKSPKLKVSKVEIDDGFSEDTVGDQNHVAGAGEKVALVVSITNEGGMTAGNITTSLSFENSLIKNLGDGTAKISLIESAQTEKARFIFEVGEEMASEFPPSAILEMSDGNGKKWSDNFYLGEEGYFEYPTGLTGEEVKLLESSSPSQ